MNNNNLSPFHTIGVKRYRQGTAKMWATASASTRIIGSKQIGVTLSFAQDLAVSVDTVEYWARAYITFLQLRPYFKRIKENCHYPTLLHIRRDLTISHFAAMGRLMRKFDINPVDAIEYLDTAATERVSARSLRTIVSGIYAGENPPLEWVSHYNQLYHLGLRYANDFEVPDRVRKATYAFLEILAEEGLGEEDNEK